MAFLHSFKTSIHRSERDTVQVLDYKVMYLAFRKFREEGEGTIGSGLKIVRVKTKEVS